MLALVQVWVDEVSERLHHLMYHPTVLLILHYIHKLLQLGHADQVPDGLVANQGRVRETLHNNNTYFCFMKFVLLKIKLKKLTGTFIFIFQY